MILASEAGYLEDDHVVFGIVVNGVAYAYPKRILAWHEMFTATLEGVAVAVAGVYCTLCGAVILYETESDGSHYQLGTSGFLYRSNKLMFDESTHSLWSTLEGRPVVGPLVGKGIQLKRRSVVTVSWGAWKAKYPGTKVLSLETGYRRDYSEGVAYRDYFATDRLMFPVPFDDQRLKNKAEIVAILLAGQALAHSVDFLREQRFFENKADAQRYVVLTDADGVHRVYQTSRELGEGRWDGPNGFIDRAGNHWKIEEEALIGANGERFVRIPSHRAFWFGWHAAYPETVLIDGTASSD